MKVESNAECSKRAFCNTFDLHKAIIGIENKFLVFFLNGPLRQVVWLFLGVPWVCLQFLIVVFPDDTHLLFLLYTLNCLAYGFV